MKIMKVTRTNGIIYFSPDISYNVKTKEISGDFNNIQFPLQFEDDPVIIFRGTYLGRYLQLYGVNTITKNELKLLYPKYSLILEQSFKLDFIFIPFLLIRNSDFFKNLSTTSISKLSDFNPKQLALIQKYIVYSQIFDFNTYLERFNLLSSTYKGVNEELFERVCQFVFNSKISNYDIDFYKQIINPKHSLTQKLNKIESITPEIIEYYNFRKRLVNNFNLTLDSHKYPEIPKKEDVSLLLAELQAKYEELSDLERYKGLMSSYNLLLPDILNLEYSESDYSILVPKELSELEIEGNVLHHCVGSYKENVAEGKEYILFLRENNNLNTPFYTIDIEPDGYIRQIHTFCNGNIQTDSNKDKIIEFLNHWADNKPMINKKSLKLNYSALGAK